MKAVIEVAKRGSAIRTARSQLAAARKGKTPDYHLSFELIERTDEDAVFVPYEAVEILLPLAQVA